jgi:hypothetical protein
LVQVGSRIEDFKAAQLAFTHSSVFTTPTLQHKPKSSTSERTRIRTREIQQKIIL